MLNIASGKIAILMATYNGEKYLRQQVESIISQTEQEFVLVIHDDGSTDGTEAIINELAATYGEGQLMVLDGPSTGSAKANFLWMLAQVVADYYMFADQDDVWDENKIEKSKLKYCDMSTKCEISLNDKNDNHIFSHNYNCIFTDMAVVDEDLNQIYPSFIKSIDRDINHTLPGQLIIDNMAAGCTMFFGKDLRDVIVDNMENVDLSKVEMHDRLIITVAAVLGKVVGIDEPLSLYRQHDNNEMGAVHESVLDKVVRNVRGRVTGEIHKGHKEFIAQAQGFAGEIYKICSKAIEEGRADISIVDIRWIQEYSQLEDRNLSAKAKEDFYRINHLERATEQATRRMYKWI
ncbi:MAG: glycosyltransferase family 2 protein [Lachnospiraceae bacterium]|nr:glycosyltransferase family 2 protein [Lachnospiraceae bacterium]